MKKLLTYILLVAPLTSFAEFDQCKVNAFAAYMAAAEKRNDSVAILKNIPCVKNDDKAESLLKIKCTVSFNPRLEKLPVDIFFENDCKKGEINGAKFNTQAEFNDCSKQSFLAGVKFLEGDIKEYIGAPNCLPKNDGKRIMCDLKIKTKESQNEVVTIPMDFDKNCEYGIFHYKAKAYEYDYAEDLRRPATAGKIAKKSKR